MGVLCLDKKNRVEIQDFKDWKAGVYLIEAGCGMGKNYFVFNTLFPYAQQNGKRMLVFSNRVALREQQQAQTQEKDIKLIQEQWQYITHELKADIRVIDMPMLDTSKNTDNLDRRFIADLVLQILSYTAQKERENIHKRQEMGIAAAQSKGVKFGRPKAQYPAEWEETYKAWKNGEITATAAMEKMGAKRTTFYKLVKRYEQKEN